MGFWDDMTYDKILADMQSRIDNTYDKREGSVVYDSCAAAALEIANLYAALQNMLDNAFADTAQREYLIRRASERGIYPLEATKATVLAVFNCEIPIGNRFSCDVHSYTVTSYIRVDVDGYWYWMTADTAGSAPNNTTGNLTPIDYVQDFRTGVITDVLVVGRDEESTEAFRQRYFRFSASETYGGNRQDYLTRLTTIDGVGGGKIYSGADFNGGGTVKIVFITSDYTAPSQPLIDSVQNYFDPIDENTGESSGTGEGIAPVGHFVTVVGVDTTTVDVDATVIPAEGFTYSELRPAIVSAIQQYFYGLNAQWANNDRIVCRIAALSSAILSVEHVADVAAVKINDLEINLVLDKDAIIELGLFNDGQ